MAGGAKYGKGCKIWQVHLPYITPPCILKMAAIWNFRIFGNFQKVFPSQKMAAIWNFRIFAKNGKTQICFYLLNHVR